MEMHIFARTAVRICEVKNVERCIMALVWWDVYWMDGSCDIHGTERNEVNSMDRLISEQAVIDVIQTANLRLASQTARLVHRIEDIPSAEPTNEMINEYCAKRCLTLVSNEFMAHIIADSGRSLRAGRLEDVLDKIRAEIEQTLDEVPTYESFGRGYYCDGKIAAYDYVLAIIDRYREGGTNDTN